jgi:L-asparaginase II
MSMSRGRQDWWRSVASRRDQLLQELFKAKVPYAELEHALLAQEKQLLRETRTEAERRLIRARTARTLFTEAFACGLRWEGFGRALRRFQRVGFLDSDDRVHAACLYVQSLELFPERAREAWAMLDAAERGTKALRRGNPLRRENLKAIAHTRQVARAGKPDPH